MECKLFSLSPLIPIFRIMKLEILELNRILPLIWHVFSSELFGADSFKHHVLKTNASERRSYRNESWR